MASTGRKRQLGNFVLRITYRELQALCPFAAEVRYSGLDEEVEMDEYLPGELRAVVQADGFSFIHPAFERDGGNIFVLHRQLDQLIDPEFIQVRHLQPLKALDLLISAVKVPVPPLPTE